MALNFITNVAGFILVLGVLIYAHEFGHFIVAKLCGVRVEVFSFGFGKRLFGRKRGDTDYRVSMIPLGGYVKMAGESPEEGQDGQVIDPGSFLTKKKWQKFLIMVAGPAMNLILAVALLTAFFMVGTEVWRDSEPVIGGVVKGKPAEAAGLRAGDRFVAANGETLRTWEDFRIIISMNAGTPVTLRVMREGVEKDFTVTPERQTTDMGVMGIAGVTQFVTTEVGRVLPGSAAEKAGLRTGDRIVGANGSPVSQLGDLESVLGGKNPSPVKLEVARGTQTVEVVLPARVPTDATYPGFAPPTKIRKFAFGEAVGESLRQNRKMLRYTFATLGRLFRAEGSVKELSGPIDIARISGEMLRTGWVAVIFLMANISLQLGIMNLLPIPVLDGGHIMILLVESVARRELSIPVKERIQQAGFFVLLALMVVVLFNDVLKNVKLVIAG